MSKSPPCPITDLVIREVPGSVLHFVAVNTEIAERLRAEFKPGEFGSFELIHASGYLHYPWPIKTTKLACYMAKVARCKFVLEFGWSDHLVGAPTARQVAAIDKQSLYSSAFTSALMMREVSSGALQFATLEPEIIKRIQNENNKHCFGKFSDAPAWASNHGRIKRAHLHINWLLDLQEVGRYLGRVAASGYSVEFDGDSQEYKRVVGDSSNG